MRVDTMLKCICAIVVSGSLLSFSCDSDAKRSKPIDDQVIVQIKDKLADFEKAINTAKNTKEEAQILQQLTQWAEHKTKETFSQELGPRFSWGLVVTDKVSGKNVTHDVWANAGAVIVKMDFSWDKGTGKFERIYLLVFEPQDKSCLGILFME